MKTFLNSIKKPIKRILIPVFLAGIITHAYAQNMFKVDPNSKMTIQGTSTLHDWTSNVVNFQGRAQIDLNKNNLPGLTSLDMEIPVGSIQSDHSLMNTKTYEALKKDKYPDIIFALQKVDKIDAGRVTASGQLTIAGVTRNVDLIVNYRQLPGDKFLFSGEKNIKMSDYNIDPPTALMGSIRSGDEITVKFETVFAR